MSKPTELPAWNALIAHHDKLRETTLAQLFAHDAARFGNFSLRLGDIVLDYSKIGRAHV